MDISRLCGVFRYFSIPFSVGNACRVEQGFVHWARISLPKNMLPSCMQAAAMVFVAGHAHTRAFVIHPH